MVGAAGIYAYTMSGHAANPCADAADGQLAQDAAAGCAARDDHAGGG